MILLLDDDVGFRAGLAGGLRQRGHRVIEMSAARDWQSSDRPERVSAIVLGSDGDECLRLADRLHEMFPSVPVVIATAQRDLAARPEAHDRDFLYCFCKPLTAAALSGMIEVLLPSRRLSPSARPD
jgi:DNA-binding NtrC family response regulator